MAADLTADEKLEELLLIVADALRDQPAAGAMKVNKACFFAEFAHVRATGMPITGAEYQRLQWGPAPRRLLPARTALVARGDAELLEESYRGRIQHRLIALRPPRWELFSESEQAAIKESLDDCLNETGTALSDLSHEEPAWDLLEDGDTIPFALAFASTTGPGPKAKERARQLVRERRAAS